MRDAVKFNKSAFVFRIYKKHLSYRIYKKHLKHHTLEKINGR